MNPSAPIVISAGGLRTWVRPGSSELAGVLGPLFQDLAPVDHRAGRALENGEGFTVDPLPNRSYAVYGPNISVDGMSLAGAVNALMIAVNRLYLDRHPGELHLHAAAASLDDRAVVLSAPSGVGKTTSVCALARSGFTYLSDELVGLPVDVETIICSPKPLSIKPSSGSWTSDLLAAASYALDPRVAAHVAASSAGFAVAKRARPALVALLDRDGSATVPFVKELHRADVVARLLEQTMDSARFGSASLQTLAEFCARSRCVGVSLGEPGATSDAIRDQLSDTPEPDRGGWVLQALHEDFVDPSVTAVLIDGRTVVHDARTGRVAAFDELGSQVFTDVASGNLGRRDPRDTGVERFVAELRTLGFLQAEQ